MADIQKVQRQSAIEDLSNCANSRGIYGDIQDISIAYFGHSIDNDDPFWHELEEEIIDKIIKHKKDE